LRLEIDIAENSCSGSNLHAGSAAALLSIIPVTVLFLFLQRYFVSGMVAGALK
jgi:raffinose/stachyose/melibiose transport system permease protein